MNQPDDQPGTPPGAGLYVDVENLNSDGQDLIIKLVENWPANVPALSRLTLYVRADQVELWRLWAAAQFRELKVAVKGTQRFSLSSSKNSADIAIATNAMADLLFRRVAHVVVFSDDSDFISLYAAIRDEPELLAGAGETPFLWVVTDRAGSLSSTVRQFFPLDQLHIVEAGPGYVKGLAAAKSPPASQSERQANPAGSRWAAIARQIIRDIPTGVFKSTDCQPIIKQHWPQHPMADAGGPVFGTEFKNKIWPELERYGVIIRGGAPVRYEMTAEAKRGVSGEQ